jgi:uncharacterized protein (UPF0218 family)
MLVLPEEKRHLFREPFGELAADIASILPRLSGVTIYSVGDIVTHNLRKHNITPSVAIVDGHTMRAPCRKMPVVTGRCLRVKNPAGTLTDELVAGIGEAVAHPPPVTIYVKGEEDLAVIPLVLAAPEGSVVLYGQPHEGVVFRTIDRQAKKEAEKLLACFVRHAGI